jgi:hypothetical protein
MSDLLKDATATLNELLRMHQLSQELLETLTVTMIWVKDYAEKHNIPLPKESSYTSLISKAQTLVEELITEPFAPNENLQHRKPNKEFTEPIFTRLLYVVAGGMFNQVWIRVL